MIRIVRGGDRRAQLGRLEQRAATREAPGPGRHAERRPLHVLLLEGHTHSVTIHRHYTCRNVPSNHMPGQHICMRGFLHVGVLWAESTGG